MQEKPTPGPWIVRNFPESEGYAPNHAPDITNASVDIRIAQIDNHWYGKKPGQIEANARLIAAAPDMLLELERCAIELGSWPERTDIPANLGVEMLVRWNAVSAIIAKARGI